MTFAKSSGVSGDTACKMLAGRRKSWRGCAAAVALLVLLVLVLLLAIVARQLLRQGRWLALPLATGGEAPPGTPGV